MRADVELYTMLIALILVKIHVLVFSEDNNNTTHVNIELYPWFDFEKKIDIHFILIVIEYIFDTHLAIDIVLMALISVLARVTCRSEHLPIHNTF